MSAQDIKINRSMQQKKVLADKEALKENFRDSKTFKFVGWGGFHGPTLRLIVRERP